MDSIENVEASEFFGGEDGKTSNRILRMKRLQERLGVGRSTVYDWMNPRSPRYNATFPLPIKLSGGCRGAIGWIESDICGWIDSKIADAAAFRRVKK